MKRIFFALTLMVATLLASSQIVDPVKWEFAQNKISETEYELVFTAKIDKGWHFGEQICQTSTSFISCNALKISTIRPMIYTLLSPGVDSFQSFFYCFYVYGAF
jgi:hypothetical protein